MDMGLLTPCHVDDLLTSAWLSPCDQRTDTQLRSLTRHRHLLDNFPTLLACNLYSPFYVYTHSQIRNTDSLSTNELITHLSNGHTSWKGDILVVKVSHQDRDIVTDVLIEDVNLIKLLVLWCTFCFKLYISVSNPLLKTKGHPGR